MMLDGRRLDPREFVAKPLKKGARVIGGTILGRIGKTSSRLAPHVRFEIRPAGRGAPRIDPKPILDGWKLLESTAIYRSKKRNPFFGDRRRAALDRPDHADEQGGAAAPRPAQPAASRSTSAAATTSPPARSTAACSRRSSTSPPPA